MAHLEHINCNIEITRHKEREAQLFNGQSKSHLNAMDTTPYPEYTRSTVSQSEYSISQPSSLHQIIQRREYNLMCL